MPCPLIMQLQLQTVPSTLYKLKSHFSPHSVPMISNPSSPLANRHNNISNCIDLQLPTQCPSNNIIPHRSHFHGDLICCRVTLSTRLNFEIECRFGDSANDFSLICRVCIKRINCNSGITQGIEEFELSGSGEEVDYSRSKEGG